MGKYKKVVFIAVNLFFSIAAIIISLIVLVKVIPCEIKKCDDIYEALYAMHNNFLELLMAFISAILAIITIVIPIMVYNWKKEMKDDFEKLSKGMKDDFEKLKDNMKSDYRNMKESMCEDMKKVKEAQNLVNDTKKEIQDLNRNIRSDMNSFSYNFLTNEIADTEFLMKIRYGDLSFLKDISTDELKSKFKPGKFSEVCVNHLLAMAKSCNCIDKKEIIANLKNIRKEAH